MIADGDLNQLNFLEMEAAQITADVQTRGLRHQSVNLSTRMSPPERSYWNKNDAVRTIAGRMPRKETHQEI